MRRTKHVIAVVVVATALCAADRSFAASPAPASDASAGLARSLASRLTGSLSRAVAPSVSVEPVRTHERVHTFALPIREDATGVRSEFSPFQFRLSPPSN